MPCLASQQSVCFHFHMKLSVQQSGGLRGTEFPPGPHHEKNLFRTAFVGTWVSVEAGGHRRKARKCDFTDFLIPCAQHSTGPGLAPEPLRQFLHHNSTSKINEILYLNPKALYEVKGWKIMKITVTHLLASWQLKSSTSFSLAFENIQ